MGRRKKRRPGAKRTGEASPAAEGRAEGCTSPYKVETSEALGRYLTARREIKAGEVIMVDEAIVVGPCQEAKPLCIGCYASIDLGDEKSFRRCGNCGWPLCSDRCPGRGKDLGHSTAECGILSKSWVRHADVVSLRCCFYAITPLRVLLLKLFNAEMWKIVQAMESHTERRRENRKLWAANEELGVDKIQKILGPSSFTPEEIHFACGVLEVNAFEVAASPGCQPLRAIYPNAFLFCHDCVPNTYHSNVNNFDLLVRATKTIPANARICVSYTYTLLPFKLQSTLKRRRHLLDTKFFSCCCERCSDATELGVFCGALLCPDCKTGFVLPENPLDENSDWQCGSSKCRGSRMKAVEIDHLNEKLSDELDAIDGNDVRGYENFLRKYRNILHENHYHCLAALHCLSQLYGKIDGYLINDLTEEQLTRKADICRRLLKVFEKLEPGLSKQRGLLLYELQAPLMVILRRRFQMRNITGREMKQGLREVNKCLEESWKILRMEWENSVEGQMAAAAKEALIGLNSWETVMEKM